MWAHFGRAEVDLDRVEWTGDALGLNSMARHCGLLGVESVAEGLHGVVSREGFGGGERCASVSNSALEFTVASDDYEEGVACGGVQLDAESS